MRSPTRTILTGKITSVVVVLMVLAGLFGFTIGTHAQATDPEAVFNALHAAINAHDVDGALAFFADDAVVQFPNQPPPNVFRGKTEMRAWLQGDANQHIQVKTEQFKVAGDRMTWIAKVDVDDVRPLGITIEGPVEAVVQNGKITSFTFTLSQETLAKLQAATAQPQSMPATGASSLRIWVLAIVGLGVLGLGLALRRHHFYRR